jgi:hypothetical protein
MIAAAVAQHQQKQHRSIAGAFGTRSFSRSYFHTQSLRSCFLTLASTHHASFSPPPLRSNLTSPCAAPYATPLFKSRRSFKDDANSPPSCYQGPRSKLQCIPQQQICSISSRTLRPPAPATCPANIWRRIIHAAQEQHGHRNAAAVQRQLRKHRAIEACVCCTTAGVGDCCRGSRGSSQP